ncbi:MAG: 4-alpha-glucanotransferase [Bryobacteraceae bacterium]|nr:4-alpha-glucanotransferase [Bryobacteraceae bacterium]
MRELIRFQPAQTLPEALQRAATAHGIEPGYTDNWGETHLATGEVQQGILRSFGIDATSLAALNAAEEERLWQHWNHLLPPTCVVGTKPSAGELTLHLRAAHLHHRVEVTLRHEDGRLERGDFACRSLPVLAEAELRGERFVRLQIPLYDELPLGYHELTVRIAETTATMALIVGPEKAWMPEGLRTAGIAISLYGLRSARNWGAGDTEDLRAFGLWAKRELGVSFIGLNPLHAIHNRQPFNTSPYLPLSAFFRNPLYIDVASVPELDSCVLPRRIQEELAALRAAEYVEYERVWRLKKRLLRLAHRRLEREDSPRRGAFDAYCQRPELHRLRAFATFCTLDEAIHRERPDVWLFTDWPDEYRSPDSPAVAEFARRHPRSLRFHIYLQWVLEQQLESVQQDLHAAGMSLGLYHDLALASDRYGFDVWYEKAAFAQGVRVGSPPDGFSPEGQDWAFPPPSPTYADLDGYRSFRELIRANAHAGGALRFDHVMRFFRLYWIPGQLSARQGAYVRNQAEALLRIIALESVREKFLVIGEDLGTVTPEMRELLDRFGILGYRLLIFERQADTFRAAEDYPALAAASVTTHDLPTLSGFLSGADIEARLAAGLLPDRSSYDRQWQERRESLEPLRVALGTPKEEWPLSGDRLAEAVIDFLAPAKSAVFILNQEEITGEAHQQNLPGSTAEYPNWRRKMKVPLEELDTLQPLTQLIHSQLQNQGRA